MPQLLISNGGRRRRIFLMTARRQGLHPGSTRAAPPGLRVFRQVFPISPEWGGSVSARGEAPGGRFRGSVDDFAVAPRAGHASFADDPIVLVSDFEFRVSDFKSSCFLLARIIASLQTFAMPSWWTAPVGTCGLVCSVAADRISMYGRCASRVALVAQERPYDRRNSL
jgi:hypothetical protein